MEFTRFINRVTFVMLLLSVGIGWLVWSARSMSQFDGYGEEIMDQAETVQYIHIIKQNLSDGKKVRLSESGLNLFLSSVIKGEQSYAVNPWVTHKGVFLNLEPGRFDLCLERQVFGYLNQSQVSYGVISEQTSSRGVKTTITPTDGMWGKLKLPYQLGHKLSPWVEEYSKALESIMSEVQPYVERVEISQQECILYPHRS